MRLRDLSLLAIVSLCIAAPVPTAAAPAAQGDRTQTYRRPAWGLSFEYPASWDQVVEKTDAVAVGYADSDNGELGALLVARDPAWTDWDYDVEEALRTAIESAGQTAPEDIELGEHLSRLVSGQKSHGSEFTATDPSSGEPIAGYIYLFAYNRMGWATVCLSSESAWESTHRARCDAALKGLIVGAPGPMPTAAPEGMGEVLFEDDFAGDGGYLGTYEAEDGHSEYAGGAYRMVVIDDGHFIFGVTANQSPGAPPKLAPPETDLAEITVDADVTKVGGPDMSYFGLACGFQNPGAFVALMISGDGRRYAIADVYDALAEVRDPDYDGAQFYWQAGQDWGPASHPAIAPGDGAVNHLRGVCSAGGILLYVNDEKVAEWPLQGELTGGVGLLAYKQGDGPDLELEFDNLVVRALPAPAEAAPGAAGEVAFEDDFSEPASGWPAGRSWDGKATTRYRGDAYEVSVPRDYQWSSHSAGIGYQDASAEVDVTALSGQPEAYAGLLCRTVGDAGYTVVINGNGRYWIGLTTAEGEQQTLIDWAGSSAIKTGVGETNRLRLDFVNDRLTLYVNERRVKALRDGALAEGYVRLVAGTTGDRAARFAFDNLTIRRP